MQQPSAPPMPVTMVNNNNYVPAPYYKVQQIQPIYIAPYFTECMPQPVIQQQDATRREGCLAGALSTLFCCCLIEDIIDE